MCVDRWRALKQIIDAEEFMQAEHRVIAAVADFRDVGTDFQLHLSESFIDADLCDVAPFFFANTGFVNGSLEMDIRPIRPYFSFNLVILDQQNVLIGSKHCGYFPH